MKKLYELEMTRNNVTPRAFYSVVRRELLKKGGVELESWVGTDGYYEWMNPSTVCDAYSTENETICKKPFDFQIAYNGAYNVILEFQFDDDNRGTGYAYICEYEAEEQPAAQEAANETEAADNNKAATEAADEPAPEFNYDFLSGRYGIFKHEGGAFSNEYETDDLKEARDYLKEETEGTVRCVDYAIFDRDARQYIQIRATAKGRKAFKVENERLAAKPATPVNQTESDSAEAGRPARQEAETVCETEANATDKKARDVFAYVCEAIKAADGDAEKLEALRIMVDSVARNGRLSPELRNIEDYIAYAFRNDEDVLEAFNLYYNRGTEETAYHFGWVDFTPVNQTESDSAAGQPAPQEEGADMVLTLTPEQAKLLLTALCSYNNVTQTDIARCSAPDALPTAKRLIEHYQRQKALNEELRATLYKMVGDDCA